MAWRSSAGRAAARGPAAHCLCRVHGTRWVRGVRRPGQAAEWAVKGGRHTLQERSWTLRLAGLRL